MNYCSTCNRLSNEVCGITGYGIKYPGMEGACNSYQETEKETDAIQMLISAHGTLMSKVICMEECSELAKEISKSIRGEGNRKKLIEEISDVIICLSILGEIENISQEELDKELENKFKKIIDRAHARK